MNLIVNKKMYSMFRSTNLTSVLLFCLYCFLFTACGSVNSGPAVTDETTDEDEIDDNDTNSVLVENQSFTTKANQELQINLNTLLTQYDASKKYTYSVVTPPSLGLVAIQNNILTYSPSQIGSDEIQFQVSEGSINSNIGKITISVNSASSATEQQSIIMINKSVATIEEEEVVIDLSTMIKSFDSTATYNFILESEPLNGTAKLNGLFITYTPLQGVTGDDTITLRAGDGESTSNLATINIEIQDLSTSAPRLQSVAYTIKPNVSSDLDLNLLFVAPHPFTDKTYTFTILQQGKLGTGVIDDRTLTYTPILNAFGTDNSLRVLVTDELGQKAELALSIIISLN